jgi:uncharacterized protein involved in response to NO
MSKNEMSPLQSSPFNTKEKFEIIFALAFRPFFLLSAVYGVWLLLRWTLTLSGVLSWQSDIPLFAWHAHEFQYGFAISVVYGFLLTAAQTWTGQKSIKNMQLATLVVLWLAARIAMNMNDYGLWISLVLDSVVLITTIVVLLKMILPSKNYRNLIFIPLLVVFLALHIGQMYSLLTGDLLQSQQIGYATSWWFVVLISLLGSRVIPFFISKAVGSDIRREPAYMTLITQLLIVVVFAFTLLGIDFALQWLIAISLIAHCYRLFIWHHKGIWKNSMLWSLWLSYAFLPLALTVLLIDKSYYSNALHLINLGFIGFMIIAFTSRVCLGHTGRKLKSTPIVTLSFVLIVIAALSRGIFLILLPQLSTVLMALTGCAWLLALVFFLLRYTSILLSARPDGTAG